MASKKTYIAAGVLAAGCAAAVTAYAVRKRRSRDKAVDAELAGMIDETEATVKDSSTAGSEPTKSRSAAGDAAEDTARRAESSINDLLAATPVLDV